MKKLSALLLLLALLLAGCGAAGQQTPPGPEAYVGRYADEAFNEVVIEERDGAVTMTVGLYRLTTLEEGTLSAAPEGLLFRTTDAAGNPMTLSFRRLDDGSFLLRAEESSWPYLEPGTSFVLTKRS